MPNEILIALIGVVVVLLGGAAGYVGGWFKDRTERDKNQTALEKQAEEIKLAAQRQLDTSKAELEAQNVKDREALRGTLQYYADQVKRLDSDLREVRSTLSDTRDQLNSAKQTIETFKQQISEKDAASQRRDARITELTTLLEGMSTRLESLEQERDSLKTSLNQRDTELKERDATIQHQQEELNTLREQLEGISRRLGTLEKNGTGALNPANVPDSDPALEQGEKDAE